MAGRNFLFVPGPTNVPDRILRSMHRAMEDHRSSAFPELANTLFPELKRLFRTTTGQPFIFPGSGTGAWEVALANTLSPGDRVIAPRYGQFSHLWIELAKRIGIRVDILDVEWGEGAPLERIAEILQGDAQHEIKGVMIVHNETATGVTSDVAGVRRALDAAKHPALLYVDGVSSIGSIDFRMDEWGVDMAVTGSQKGLMLPAGLGILCASPKALAAREQAKCARAFFDLGDMIKANATGYFPYTPAVLMLYGLRESLAMIFEEGLETVLRPSPAARRRRACRDPRLGPEALRQGAQVELQHGQCDHGAGRDRWRPGDRRRVPALQPRARRRAGAHGREAVPHRPHGGPERSHAAGRARRDGDGHARRRHPDHTGVRSRCG